MLKAHSNEQRASLFFKGAYQRQIFANPVRWDFEHIAGYMSSASYMPVPGSKQAEEMLAALRRIFDLHEKDGSIHFSFATELICGRL